MRPATTCVCGVCNPISTRTRFVILMHPKEYKKEKNGTGHMTRLQLDNSEIIVGVDFTHNKRVNEILSDEKCDSFLLYPGRDSFNVSIKSDAKTKSFIGCAPHIFILDGTWPCARKMISLSTNLQKLKRVSFDSHIKSKFIFKQQPEALCLSTIESVYTVINLLREHKVEHCDTKVFLSPFEKMIEYQTEYILNQNNKNYHSSGKKGLVPKTNYKKNKERNIFFEQ